MKMTLLTWDETYSVNVNLIDGQHKKLFNLANGYSIALEQGRSKLALCDLLDGLANYASIHFSTEERYFNQFNYSDSEEHMLEHEILSNKICDLKSKIKTGISVENDEVSKFLKVWLDTHIKGTDHKYIECFNSNGLR
jgi:hemerythrin